MKKCVKCSISVDTSQKLCPLCFSVLESKDETVVVESKYPSYNFYGSKYNVFLRIITFITILASLASIIGNIISYQNDPTLWSIIVILGLVYIWVLLRSTIKSRSKTATKIMIQMLTLSLVVLGIDLVSGYDKWSINYVIPFLSIASLLSIISLVIGNGVRFGENSLYLFAATLLGLIPFILWLFNLVDVLWPSLIAASLSFATIIGLIVFADKVTKEEIKKRFHI